MKQLGRMIIGALVGNFCLTACIVAFHAVVASGLFKDGQYALILLFAGFVGGIVGAGAYPVHASRSVDGRYEAVVCISCSVLALSLLAAFINMVSSNATTVADTPGEAIAICVWLLAPTELAALGALAYGVHRCVRKAAVAPTSSHESYRD